MTGLAVGLVGAGPWATLVHGPMLAAGPETQLAGVWARRPEAAAALGARLGAPAFDRYEPAGPCSSTSTAACTSSASSPTRRSS